MPETITLTKPLKGFIDILRITQGLRPDQYPEIVLVGAAKDSMVDQIADALLYANGGDRQKFRERIGRSSRVRLTPVESRSAWRQVFGGRTSRGNRWRRN